MNKVLLEEPEVKDARYLKRCKGEKRFLAVMLGIFLMLGLLCLVFRLFALSIVLFVFVLALAYCYIMNVCQEKQYLRIYGDRICYKTLFWGRETQIMATAVQYRIEVKRAVPRSGYSLILIFSDAGGRKLLCYKAVALFPSRRGEEKQPWERALFAIGCEVSDAQEVIVNR